MEATSSAITTALLKFDDSHVKQGISFYGVEEEAEELVAELTWVKCFLVDGEETRQGRSRVSIWAAIIERYALKVQKVLAGLDHAGVDVEIGGEHQSLLSVENVAQKMEIENILNKFASLREKLQIYVTFGVGREEETSNLSKAPEAKHSIDPPREIKVTKWGGRGGGEWSYRPKAAIKLVVVAHGRIIDSISFMSRDDEFSERLGGRGGSTTTQVRINSPLEYLTGISGTYGGYGSHVVIRSLKFHTNMKEHGPMGTQDGTPFSFVMQEGVIVGFYGRAGYFLDAIGVYATPKYDLEN